MEHGWCVLNSSRTEWGSHFLTCPEEGRKRRAEPQAGWPKSGAGNLPSFWGWFRRERPLVANLGHPNPAFYHLPPVGRELGKRLMCPFLYFPLAYSAGSPCPRPWALHLGLVGQVQSLGVSQFPRLAQFLCC